LVRDSAKDFFTGLTPHWYKIAMTWSKKKRLVFSLTALLLCLVFVGILAVKAKRYNLKNFGIKNIEIKHEGLLLKEIHLLEDDPQKPYKWYLDAKEVSIDKNQKEFRFKDYFISFTSQEHGNFSMTGSDGVYLREQKKFVLNGIVKIESTQGYSASANGIVFDEFNGIIYVQGGVEFLGKGINLKGDEFVLDLNLNKIKMAKNIKAVFTKQKVKT